MIVRETLEPVEYDLVGAVQVFEGDQLMLISDQGTLVRTRGDEVSVQGRNTQGVRIIKLKEGEKLVGLERIDEPEEDPIYDEESAPAGEEPSADTEPSDE